MERALLKTFLIMTLALFLFAALGGTAIADDTVKQNTKKLLDTRQCPNCNLVGADLKMSFLLSANLAGADLSNANLHRAFLSDANLTEANLTGADISGADFGGADLTGATWIDGRICAAGSIGTCK